MILTYKIDDVNIRSLGAVPGKLQHLGIDGLFNLPKRIGTTEYNWGNSIEPFVQAEDIELDGRTLTFLAIVERNRVSDFTIACVQAKKFSCGLDEFNVACKDAITVDEVGHYCTVEVKFWQYDFKVNTLTQSPSGTGDYMINNYDLRKDFGAIMSMISGMNSVGKRIDVPTTEFYKTTYFRDIRTLAIRFAMLGSSLSDLYYRMSQLHALLASPGMKTLKVRNNLLSVYFKDGLTAQLLSDKLLTFDLKATVND